VATSRPLPGNAPDAARVAPGPSVGGERTRSRETRFVAATGISVGIVAVIVLTALLLSGPPAPASPSPSGGGNEVRISSVQWNLAGFPCDGDPEISSGPGTTVAPGAMFTENRTLVNQATLGSCTFSNPVVPAGFTLVSSNLPITLNALQNATLSLNITAPANPWSGTLDVSVGVSTAF
jgi:hypothetical protein